MAINLPSKGRRNRGLHMRDLFIPRTTYNVGGAKVVTDRNLLFVSEAAKLQGHGFEQIVPAARRGSAHGLWDRLIFLLFRIDKGQLAIVLHSARRGDLANVWLDHAALGLVIPLLWVIRQCSRFHHRRWPRLHLFHHNNEFRYLLDEYREMGSTLTPKRRFQLALTWFQQRVGAAFADRNYFISPSEVTGSRATVLPPSWPALSESLQKHESGDFVLLVGSQFFANEHGFRWYIENVAEVIAAPTIIAGRGLDEVFVSSGKVTVLGFVDDLDALYSEARIVAVPIFRGAGTKVKLVEAIHAGCQVVATPQACEGLADRAALLASGQLIEANSDCFSRRLSDELAARPKAPHYAHGAYIHDRFLPSFLAAYLS
ncbi:glycosyltransferase [Pseudoroseicyclus sp. CXY001]|uniref:glycosyltransferase n=1 Tax=Pseudoroseicyclus sp. CXY001 TaxID=3242492 RepID=UPI003570F89B